ncbi:muscarinic acetylcholine receptor M3 [Hydra vulgaris]|uniref:muscarinic acetylcholine receptor M3 n=1 Tax=Hydra vulgaris TaxID=6087 RepID=UPI001F5F23CA|nr:muscarinic acetylcholine receptor M3 [Hydra vulgaris]XP_012558635.2 muscarinic acetylcholine receptor M3 [Hydra vulgaris]XP_047134048.1 muscarinic acetylcholine receptor M3 [Hydra vulgaris]XP_047134049.1 muscarinic acetylcholine receptor M3 [Hydra vulgaris]XP_047134050.1 muscarinic acetylcholine receptor M3 [Hydra vulgaris]
MNETMHSLSEGEKYFNSVFLTFAAFVAILGNTVALHAFFVSPQLKKMTYYFIASLCFSDLMVAIISIPIWVVDTQSGWKYTIKYGNLKLFHSFLDIFCSTWSIMSLAMISIERFVCINYCLRYHSIMTPRRGIFMILLTLVYSLVAAGINYLSLDLFDNKKWFVILQWVIIFMSYLLPVFIKLFTYTKIYIEAKRQSSLIKEQYSTISSNKTKSNEELESIDIDNMHFNKNKRASFGSRASWSVLSTAGLKFLRKKEKAYNASIKRERNYNALLSHENSSDEADFDDFCSIKKLFKKRSKPINKYDVNQNGVHQYELESSISNSSGLNTLNSNNSNNLREKMMLSIPEEMLDTITYPDLINTPEPTTPELTNQHEETLENRIYCEISTRDRAASFPIKFIKRSGQCLEPDDNTSYISKTNSTILFNKMRYSMRSSPANSPLMSSPIMRQENSTKIKREKKIREFKREMRATKVIGLIMGTFLFCWTPFMAVIILSTIAPRSSYLASYIMFTKDLHYLNCAINPILYVVLNRVYRSAVLKTFKQIKLKLFCLSKTF